MSYCFECNKNYIIGCPTHKIEQDVSNSALSDGLVDHALKKQLDRLLCVVNAVTCPHRHGQPIRPKDLTRLANRQIEVEEALREMGY